MLTEPKGRLYTKAEYDQMSPVTQGFWQYMDGDWPGSELKGLTNPYPEGTADHQEWERGQALGVQAAQDSEE